MLDRASIFADPEVIELLKTKLVPVAIDCWAHERRRDAEGELYRKVVFQRDGMRKDRTTQGLYLFDPNGKLFHGWNNRDTPKAKRYMRETVAAYRPPEELAPAREAGGDAVYAPERPEGTIVADVFSRVLKATWPEKTDRWAELFRDATGRDHLWILPDEAAALGRGEMPEALADRIARYHLMDNTRGEPPFWRREELARCELTLTAVEGTPGAFVLSGRITLAADGRRYDAAIRGEVAVAEGRLARFDLVAAGEYEGHGKFTSPSAPVGPFTFAVAFTLAAPEDEAAASVPPQGMKDWWSYLPAKHRPKRP